MENVCPEHLNVIPRGPWEASTVYVKAGNERSTSLVPISPCVTAHLVGICETPMVFDKMSEWDALGMRTGQLSTLRYYRQHFVSARKSERKAGRQYEQERSRKERNGRN